MCGTTPALYAIRCRTGQTPKSGFTLIELSIVLVVLGIIVGGIFLGSNLIDAAVQRAQIAQIDQYQTAVRLFETQYKYLPGDIPASYASRYGFQPRGLYSGEGDGNGILESNCGNIAGTHNGTWQGCGELAVFWEDLSTAKLIDTTIYGSDAKGNGYPDISTHYQNVTGSSTPNTAGWLPVAKISTGNYIYLYSSGLAGGSNYFTVSAVTKIGWNVETSTNPGLTVQQAYNIDNKIDDGLPQSGSVTACYENYLVSNSPTLVWAAGGGLQGASGGTDWSGSGTRCTATTSATSYLSTNCFDNNGVAGTQTYSLKNGNLQNCALSFVFQ